MKKTDYIQARMSPELKTKLKRGADERGQSMTTFILRGLAKAYPELKIKERSGEIYD
jgi:uncharacterized protein (DUF1778 family)